jgi:hypothetical protein
MQPHKQGSKQEKRGNPKWVTGVSQNPRGRESNAARRARRDAIIAAWAEPHGGVASLEPAEMTLLRQAAELDMSKSRTAEDRVRTANAIAKSMLQVGFVGGKPQPVKGDDGNGNAAASDLPSLTELLERRRR